MNKIALYIRLSIEDSKVESMSVENQKLALHKFVDTQDDLASYEVQEFVDNGYSGTNLERPALQEMLDGVRAGEIRCIVVKDFSRFGRNSLEVGYFMEKVFPLYGVRFIALNDEFDTARLHGDTGGINVAFKYLINEFYSRDLSMKYKSAKYVKFRRGEYQSKLCPYGYQKGENGRLEPDPETAPNVQFIFEMAARESNTTGIIKALLEREICTPGEYKVRKGQANFDVSRSAGVWCKTTVLHIITDERYTGTYVMGKRRCVEIGSGHVRMKDESEWVKIPNHHPALVSTELYEQVQSKFRHGKCVKKETHPFPLQGKVFCGCCHHALRRIESKNPYFFCDHSKIKEKAPCHGLRIEEAALEAMIYQVLSKQAWEILSTNGLESAGAVEAPLVRQNETVQQIDELQARKKNLFEEMVLGKTGPEEYRWRKAALDHELSQLQQIQAALASQIQKSVVSESEKKAREKLAQKVVDTGALSTELADALIERVYVFPGPQVEITWKTQGFGAEVTER